MSPFKAERRVHYICCVAFLVRTMPLYFSKLPELLDGRIELSTPITAYKRLSEGITFMNMGVQVYDGGVVHTPPLLLVLIRGARALGIETLLWAGVDVLCAIQFFRLSQLITKGEFGLRQVKTKNASSRPEKEEHLNVSSPHQRQVEPWILTAAVLFNPLQLLVAISRSTATFTTLAIFSSLVSAMQSNPGESLFWLSLSTYLGMYPALLLPSLLLLLLDQQKINRSLASGAKASSNLLSIVKWCLLFMAFLAIMGLGSTVYLVCLESRLEISAALPLMLASTAKQWLYQVYMTQILFIDLTPNIGLWCVSVALVDLCRSSVYKAGSSPMFVLTTLLGLQSIFKPYPSVSDSLVYVYLVLLFPSIWQWQRYTFLISCILLYCIVFGPAFWYLWIYTGQGNANFFYAITLVWNLGMGLGITDAVWGYLRFEWEDELDRSSSDDERRLKYLGKKVEMVQVAI